MKGSGIIIAASLALGFMAGTVQAQKLSIRFDKPTVSRCAPIWAQSVKDAEEGNPKALIASGDQVKNPDQEWESQSLPLGNGSLGANILGSVAIDRITFNEKTLWRGGPNTSKGADYYWNVNKKSAHIIPQIREAFVDGDLEKAAQLTRTNFNSAVPYESYGEEPFRFGSFTTMGEFALQTGLDEKNIKNYCRELFIDRALAQIVFESDGVEYKREYFISYPANMLVIRYSANKRGMQHVTFNYHPNPVSTGSFSRNGEQGLLYHARLDNNNMEYAVRIEARTKGGVVDNHDNKLRVKGADELYLFITADTDYAMNFAPDFTDPQTYVGVKPLETTAHWMQVALTKRYDQLLKEHQKDYRELFDRVIFEIKSDDPIQGSTPTNERLAAYRQGTKDTYLETLYYQYGRYLLIASSRPGNLPANLQGIWHNNVDGPWRIDYHNNINIQMNYWPACATQLEECMLPLIDFIRTLIKPGERTAQDYFGARGWTAAISANIFGFASPLESEDMSWNFNPMAGPWLATHVWDYYDYTRDLKFLKETGYDIIKSSALFAQDYLWHRPDGTYTAAPSTSPEHGPVDEGAAFVHGVIREILLDAIEASKVLMVDEDQRKEWQEVLDHLVPYRIGRYGQLMEWSRDIDDPKDNHRHVNHLFGLHPGRTISMVETPDLAEASRVVLEHRGDGATGWSMGWKLNQWARLHDGNHAYTLYGNLLKNGTLDNLWDTHPPFQIDGNFGGTSGVTEMLMQSHLGLIDLLPALPDAWSDGQITGLLARGAFVVDIFWKEGRLEHAVVRSRVGGPCRIRYNDDFLEFETQKDKAYRITVQGEKLSYKRI